MDPISKARANPKSFRSAINGKCWDCVGAGEDPNPRRAIRECPIPSCALYQLRPYQNVRTDGAERAANANPAPGRGQGGRFLPAGSR